MGKKSEEDFEEYDGVTAASLLLYYLANQLNFHLITSYLVDHHQITFLFVRRIIIIYLFFYITMYFSSLKREIVCVAILSLISFYIIIIFVFSFRSAVILRKKRNQIKMVLLPMY